MKAVRKHYSPVWTGGNLPPPYPFTSPPSTLFFLVSFTFFPFLLASSILLLFHPFPFYPNSPTPFQGRKS